jgi:signal peptidase I
MTDTQPASRADSEARERRRKTRGIKLFIRDIILIFVAAIIISVGIKTFLIRSFYIPSSSMEDTLQVQDRIIVNQLIPDVFPVEHGDIVVFKDPGGWLNPVPQEPRAPLVEAVDWMLSAIGLSAPDSNDHLIKRVIGLPGDEVACCNAFGQLSVNGVPIEEPYVKLPDKVTKVSKDDFAVTVPADSLWVLGDNRYNSCDSRCNTSGPTKGFVPMDHVVGRAFMVSWPSQNWTWLDNYPQAFAGVDEGQ